MTNTTNILRTTTRAASFFAMSLIAGTAAFATIETAAPSDAQAFSNSVKMRGVSRTIRLPGGTTTKIRVPKRPSTKRISTNLRKMKTGSVRVHGKSGSAMRSAGKAFTKGTKIHLAPGASRHLPHEAWHVVNQGRGRTGGRPSSFRSIKSTKSLSSAGRSVRTVKNAKAANTARKAAKTMKAAKAAKYAVAGTGVGAVVSVGAGLAGLDPVEMAALKATNPAEYNRRMRDLKKNPVKYVGKNVANNTKKAAQNIGNAGKKVGCGIGNAFKKKSKRKKC